MQISNGVNNQKLNNILKDPNTNWKYIAIVAVVGLVAVSGILVYQNLGFINKSVPLPAFLATEKETPEETLEMPGQSQVPTDWEIYTNNEYGFEIKYPKSTRVVLENILLENKDLVLIMLGLTEPDTPTDQDMGFPSFTIAVRRGRKDISK